MAARDHLQPQQLRMFMSAREITSGWQGLDADREELGGEFSTSGRHMTNDRPETEPEMWDRKYDESGMSPRDRHDKARGSWGVGTEDVDNLVKEGALPAKKYVATGGRSTFDREGMGGRWVAAEGYTGRDPNTERSYEDTFRPYGTHPSFDTTLRQSVISEGVKNPVRLGQQIGSLGKPQIAGGHHRIAVMSRHRPDDLMPVLHDESIAAARSDETTKAFRYT